MTLEEKVGQMFAIGFEGTEFSQTRLEHLITEHKMGNFIHFSRNAHAHDSEYTALQSLQATRALNESITQCVEATLRQRPFIMVDEEGGSITHVFGEGQQYPGARVCAQGGTPKETREIACALGNQMRLMGFTVNLAPVVDVNSNPANPIIDVRSYGDTPQEVITYARAFCKGLQDGGILPVLKHFPGHGDTSEDSHLTLPTVEHALNVLQERELSPFVDLLSEVPFIMTAHILFPAIEREKLPSTLSRRIIQEFLVEKLRFKGLVISDCMEMKAIADNYPNFAVQAIKAGVHVVLVSHTHEVQIAAKDAVLQAVRSGEIAENVIDNAVEKILSYKKNMGTYKRNMGSFADVMILREYPKKLITKMSSAAITCVRDDGFFTDITQDECVYVDVLPRISKAQLTVSTALNRALPHMNVVTLPFEFSEEDIARACEICSGKKVILGTYDALLFPMQQRLCKKLHEGARALCVIAMKNPNDITALDFVTHYLCAYEYTFCSAKAVSQYLEHAINTH